MRRAAKVDANQGAIVAALRKAGATVQHLHTVGDDCPDLLIGYRSRNYIIEVKIPGEKMRDGQIEWMQNWRGSARIARSIDEALRAIGAVK
jgi:hypothetical protein